MLTGQQADMQVIKGHYWKVKTWIENASAATIWSILFSTALLSDVISFPFLTSLIKTVSLLLLSAALTSCLAGFPYAASPFCSFLSQRSPPPLGFISTSLLGCTVFVSASPTEGAQQDALCKHIYYIWPVSLDVSLVNWLYHEVCVRGVGGGARGVR